MRYQRLQGWLGAGALVSMLGFAPAAALAGAAEDVVSRDVDVTVGDHGRAGMDRYWEHREPRELPGPVVDAVHFIEGAVTAHSPATEDGLMFDGRAGRPSGLDWAGG